MIIIDFWSATVGDPLRTVQSVEDLIKSRDHMDASDRGCEGPDPLGRQGCKFGRMPIRGADSL